MNIRKATIEDLDKIQKLSLSHTNEEIDLYDPTLDMNWVFSDEGKEFYIKYIENENYLALVAEESGQITGIITGLMCSDDSSRKIGLMAEVRQMYVAKDFRNQSLGTQLMQGFFDWAKENGATRVRVEASFTNADAIRFYKKNGFEEYDLILEQDL